MKKIAKRLLISLLACIMGLIPWFYGRYFESDSWWIWILQLAFISIVFIIHDLLDAYFKNKKVGRTQREVLEMQRKTKEEINKLAKAVGIEVNADEE